MKKKAFLFIFSVMLLLTLLVSGVSIYTSNQNNQKLIQSIKNNLFQQVKNKLIRFGYSLVPIGKEIRSIEKKAYPKLIPEIKKRLRRKSFKRLGVKSRDS